MLCTNIVKNKNYSELPNLVILYKAFKIPVYSLIYNLSTFYSMIYITSAVYSMIYISVGILIEHWELLVMSGPPSPLYKTSARVLGSCDE